MTGYEMRIHFLNELIGYMQADMKVLQKMGEQHRKQVVAKCEEYELVLPDGYNVRDPHNTAYTPTLVLCRRIQYDIRKRILAARNEIAEMNLLLMEWEQK